MHPALIVIAFAGRAVLFPALRRSSQNGVDPVDLTMKAVLQQRVNIKA